MSARRRHWRPVPVPPGERVYIYVETSPGHREWVHEHLAKAIKSERLRREVQRWEAELMEQEVA